MSWRRRVLAFSIITGAGILSFGPVLTHGISRRIATQWDAETSIEKSKLSFQNHSITLSGVEVKDPISSFNSKQIYIKFDAERLLYRDCVIESLIAKDTTWEVSSNIAEIPASNTPPQNNDNSLTSIETAFRELDASLESSKSAFESKLKSLEQIIQDAEIGSRNKNQLIENQLQRLEAEVASLSSPETYNNPLRTSRAMETIRSQSQDIEKLLAEERLLIFNARKSIDSSISSIQKSAASPPSLEFHHLIDTERASLAVANALLEHVSNTLQPYAKASQIATERLLVWTAPANVSNQKPTDALFATSDFGTDVVFKNIRPRITKILKGRVQGTSILAGVQEDFELNLQGTEKSLLNPSGRINIYWKSSAPQAIENTVSSDALTQSFVNLERTATKQTNLTYQIKREELGSHSGLKAIWDSTSAQCSVYASLAIMKDIPSILELPLAINKYLESHSSVLVHGECTIDDNSWPVPQRTSWKVADSEIASLKSWMDNEIQSLIHSRSEQLATEFRDRSQQSSSQTKVRLQTLESDLKSRQDRWVEMLTEQLNKARDWESQQLRTTTLPLSIR